MPRPTLFVQGSYEVLRRKLQLQTTAIVHQASLLGLGLLSRPQQKPISRAHSDAGSGPGYTFPCFARATLLAAPTQTTQRWTILHGTAHVQVNYTANQHFLSPQTCSWNFNPTQMVWFGSETWCSRMAMRATTGEHRDEQGCRLSRA